MAHHSSGHSLGRRCGLPLLFPLFPESDERCALPSWPRLSRSTTAPVPYAPVAVFARRVDGFDHREPADVHPGPLVSPRRLVLLSCCVRSQIPSGLSRIAGAGGCACVNAEGTRQGERSNDSRGTRDSLARPLGIACCFY